MPIFIPLICLMAMGLALFRRSVPLSPAGPEVRDDVPARLLRWAAGLLSAQRAEWGQAMLGELDHIDGLGRRWRFAAGCAGAAAAAAALGPGRRGGGAVVAGRGRQRRSVRLGNPPVRAGRVELGGRGGRAGPAGRLHPGRPA